MRWLEEAYDSVAGRDARDTRAKDPRWVKEEGATPQKRPPNTLKAINPIVMLKQCG